MDYAQLGNSSLRISRIGFGCMSLKGTPQEDSELLQYAAAVGINFFDTADLYDKGRNESLVGSAFKGMRHKIILATKVGNQWKQDGSGWNWNPSKEYILKAVEESLTRLQTDYIDLYQLHGGTLDDPIDETIEAFEILMQQGKIRYYGVSSIRPNVIKTWMVKSRLVSVMMQYSLLDRRPEELFPLFQENKVGLLARGTLAQGVLVDKPAREVLDYTVDDVARVKKEIQKLTGLHANATQIAIQFALAKPEVTAAIAGIRSRKQLEALLPQAGSPVLPDNLSERLSGILQRNYYQDHR